MIKFLIISVSFVQILWFLLSECNKIIVNVDTNKKIENDGNIKKL